MSKGFEHDRRWMMIDENGKYITQRDRGCEVLVGLRPEITPDGMEITIPRASQKFRITMDDVYAADPIKVTMKGVDCEVFPAPEDATQALSDFLGRAVRLVHMPEYSPRQTDLNYSKVGDDVSLADNFPLLVTTQASLNKMRSELGDQVNMMRFRPNLVIADAEPFAEDRWKLIQIGDVTIEFARPCDRCVIINIDQTTGEKEPAILKGIIAHRGGNDRKPYFGTYATPRQLGTIMVGQKINILEKHAGYGVLQGISHRPQGTQP